MESEFWKKWSLEKIKAQIKQLKSESTFYLENGNENPNYSGNLVHEDEIWLYAMENYVKEIEDKKKIFIVCDYNKYAGLYENYRASFSTRELARNFIKQRILSGNPNETLDDFIIEDIIDGPQGENDDK